MAFDPNAKFDTLTKAFENLGNVISKTLTPAMTDLLKVIPNIARNIGKAFLDAAEGWIKPLTQKLGAAIGSALEPIATKIGSVFGAIAGNAETWLKPLTQKLGSVFGAIGGIGGKAISGLGSAVAGLAGGFGKAVGGAAAFGEAMGAMVAKASPGVFQKFTLAMDDMQAVIGHALVPVFELVTSVIRAAGDTLTTFVGAIGGAISTVMKPMVDILKVFFDVFGRVGQVIGKLATAAAPALATIGNAFLAMYEAIHPVLNLLVDLIGGALTFAIQSIADAVTTVVPFITAFVQVLGDMITSFTRWVRELLAFIGINLPEGAAGTKPGGSVGAAAKGTSIGSVESIISKAQQSAFALGTGGGDPAKVTASAVTEISKKVADIKAAIERIPSLVEELPGKIAAAIRSGAAAVPGIVKDAARDAIGPTATSYIDTAKGYIDRAADTDLAKAARKVRDFQSDMTTIEGGGLVGSAINFINPFSRGK